MMLYSEGYSYNDNFMRKRRLALGARALAVGSLAVAGIIALGVLVLGGLPWMSQQLAAVVGATTFTTADNRIGVNLNGQFLSPSGVDPQALALLSQSDIGWVRVFVQWPNLQPTANGAYRWAALDADIASLRAQGIHVLLTVRGTPCWAALDPSTCSGSDAPWQAPQKAAWQKFLTDLVAHYNGKVYWYEIWNESNYSFELKIPNATSLSDAQLIGYRDEILIPAAQAIHAADPSARVLGPTMGPAGKDTKFYTHMLTVVLGNAAGSLVDAVSLHI
jgi:hypothetical protein